MKSGLSSTVFPIEATVENPYEFPNEVTIDLNEGFTWAATLRMRPRHDGKGNAILDIGENKTTSRRFQLRLSPSGILLFNVCGYAVAAPKIRVDTLIGKFTMFTLMAKTDADKLNLKLLASAKLMWTETFEYTGSSLISGPCRIGAALSGDAAIELVMLNMSMWDRTLPVGKMWELAERSEARAAAFDR